MHDDPAHPPGDEELARWIRQHPEVWHLADDRSPDDDDLAGLDHLVGFEGLDAIGTAWLDGLVDRALARSQHSPPVRHRHRDRRSPERARRHHPPRSRPSRFGQARRHRGTVLTVGAATLCVAALGAALFTMRDTSTPPPAAADRAEITQPNPPAIDLTTPSEHPIDAEWRALLSASVPEFLDVSARANREVSRRLEACMQNRGFEFSLGHLDGEQFDWRVLRNPLRADTIPLGYHLPPEPGFIGDATEITPEMELALDGGADPSDLGDEAPPPCNVGAEVSVLTPFQQKVNELWSGLAASMDAEVGAYSSTPEAVALTTAWTGCMSAHGYTYASQMEPRIAFEEQPEITELEVVTRTTDYECDVQVDLTASRSVWQRHAYEQWRATHATDIHEFTTAVDELSAALLAAESEQLPAGVGSRAANERAQPTAPDEPFDVYGFLIGYDPVELFQASNRLQGEYVATCMADRGFDPSRIGEIVDVMFMHPVDPAEAAAPSAEIARSVADIESGRTVPVDQQQPQHADMTEPEWLAFDECQLEADDAFPNPSNTLFDVIGEIVGDVSRRVDGDPRVVAAGADTDRCIADVGYAGGGGDIPWNNLRASAADIVKEYVSGAMPKATAVQELNALVPIEAAMTACYGASDAVRYEVHAEIWQATLAANPGLLTEVRAALESDLALYRQYL